MRVRLKSSAVLQDFVAPRKGDTALKQKCLLESQARMALNATTATTPREAKLRMLQFRGRPARHSRDARKKPRVFSFTRVHTRLTCYLRVCVRELHMT